MSFSCPDEEQALLGDVGVSIGEDDLTAIENKAESNRTGPPGTYPSKSELSTTVDC
jgi:hypothetical protein